MHLQLSFLRATGEYRCQSLEDWHIALSWLAWPGTVTKNRDQIILIAGSWWRQESTPPDKTTELSGMSTGLRHTIRRPVT